MWLPVQTVRREFPELVPLHPGALELIARQAVRALPFAERALIFGAAVGLGAAIFVAAMIGLLFVAVWMRVPPDIATLFLLVALGATAVGVAVGSGRSIERAALRRRLKGPTCSACGYPLVRLPAPRGEIQCPECGAGEYVRPDPPEGTG